MPTSKQNFGAFGEKLIAKKCTCPKCKKTGSLKRLPQNFKCTDIICDFCGYLAQVKTKRTNDLERLPDKLLGAAWSVQKERMDAGKYFPLFLVLVKENARHAREVT